MKLSIPTPILFAVVCVAVALAAYLVNNPQPAIGSVPRGGEYQSTTTSPGRFPAQATLVDGSGTLGTVTITGAGAGDIFFYDATTTNITQRATSISSSSILVAHFPPSAAAGTYVFDAIIKTGLIIETRGVIPTSTVMFRQ